MAKKLVGLAESIKASLPVSSSHTPWHRRIDAAVLSELKILRAEWQSGTLHVGRRTLASAISQRLRAEGLSTIGRDGVSSWLNEKD